MISNVTFRQLFMYQDESLMRWKRVLKPYAYVELEQIVKKDREALEGRLDTFVDFDSDEGSLVLRGDSLNEIVVNKLQSKEWE